MVGKRRFTREGFLVRGEVRDINHNCSFSKEIGVRLSVLISWSKSLRVMRGKLSSSWEMLG